MTTWVNERPMSLLERKKQQWAKEREELAHLGAPWGRSNNSQNIIRDRYGSKLKPPSSRGSVRDAERRSSLPPLYKNQYNSYDKDRGGETSGYGSDNPNTTPDYNNTTSWTQNNHHQSGYESSCSFRDDRPKWGDKGVGVGKFWQPRDETFDKPPNEPPNWVKRGLQDGEILVSNNSPPAASPEQRCDDQERPYTSSSYSQSNQRSFIRGQNIPVDAVELEARERRRQLALAHQEAIRQQLEERERRRKEEQEKRIKEEREEELRIEREQEIERQRKEREQKLLEEKLERERKRKEAIKEALELAEKEAKLEKTRLKMQKQNTVKTETKNIVDKEENIEETNEEKKNNCEVLNNARPIVHPPKNELLTKEINNNLENPPKENVEISPVGDSINITPRQENIAVFLQTPLDSIQNVQYAVLLPTNTPQIPFAIPLSVPTTGRQSVLTSARTENRILTPTQYRNRHRRTCDSSTQTDYSDSSRSPIGDNREKYVREKLTNLELTYDNRRKEQRSRSESVGERPKWGANRPPTRYLKQSEKDPLYQRRKLRQKQRGKCYDEKNSSDESQPGSPKYIRKKRHSMGTWRKDDEIYTRNIRMYQTEIVPLEADRDKIYYKCCCVCSCQRHKCGENVKVDILEIEHTSPREKVQYTQEVIQSEKLPDFMDNKLDILEKLNSLHDGLLLEQEKWENSPRTPEITTNSQKNV